MIAVNICCMFFSAWVASTCNKWTFGWWFNVFAVVLNAVAVMYFLIG